jgi:hypothetical protein
LQDLQVICEDLPCSSENSNKINNLHTQFIVLQLRNEVMIEGDEHTIKTPTYIIKQGLNKI